MYAIRSYYDLNVCFYHFFSFFFPKKPKNLFQPKINENIGKKTNNNINKINKNITPIINIIINSSVPDTALNSTQIDSLKGYCCM